MYSLKLTGTITSKRAFHVPVFRRWRLVFERREFGTKIDRIDAEFPLYFHTGFDIPDGGVEVKLPAGFSILIKRMSSSNVEPLVRASVLFEGYTLPGWGYTFTIPDFDDLHVLDWRSKIYKGVELDLYGSLYYTP
ncbi:MAG: hypothetical protein ABL984_00525 [Pyrinomonadaceae bacterium]